MPSIILSPRALAALDEWNRRTSGRAVHGNGVIIDEEIIERLKLLMGPGESIEDTIIRLTTIGGASKQ